jgi:hypothetical protein
MGHPACRSVTEDAIAGLEHRGESNEVGGGNAIQNQRSVATRVGAHVLQRQRLGMAFEALEKRHVARKAARVLGGDSPAAVHAREVVDAVPAHAAHAVSDHPAGTQHALHFLVRALEYRAARVADYGVYGIAEPVGRGGAAGGHDYS